MRPFRRARPQDRAAPSKIVEVTFPAEWDTAPPLLFDLLLEAKVTATGEHIVIAGGVLEDGTNLLALAYPGGQRTVRMSPVTGGAIEERLEGRELSLDSDEPIRQVWRTCLDQMIDAKRAGGIGSKTC